MAELDFKSEINAIVDRIQALAEKRKREDATLTPEQQREALEEIRTRHGVLEPPLAERLKQRGVPKRFADLILAGKVRDTDATRLAWRLNEREGLLLVLAGNTGRGKSLAAAWLLSQCPGLWLESWRLATPDESGTLDARARTCGVVVVDDLGVEHSPSGYAAARLDALVAHRDAARRPTLLTTNLSAEAFRERYGARIASRVNGDELGWQELGGPDLRGVA